MGSQKQWTKLCKKQLFQGSRNQPKADNEFRIVYSWKSVKSFIPKQWEFINFSGLMRPSRILSPSSISRMLVYQSKTDYENKQLHVQRGHPWFRAENKTPHLFQLKLANTVGKEWSKHRTSDLLAWNCSPSESGGGEVEHSGIELGAYGGKRAKQVLDMLSSSPETTRKLSGCAGEMQARESMESKSQGRWSNWLTLNALLNPNTFQTAKTYMLDMFEETF